MKLASNRLAKKVVGVLLAAFVVTSLAACGTADKVNQDYLVLENVKAVDCTTVDSPATVAKEMQATADFVASASAKQTTDIIALNKGLESTDPLTAELDAKIKDCSTIESTPTPTPTPTATDDDTKSPNATDSAEKVGVVNADGTYSPLPIYGSPDATLTFDSTTDPNTPPLLDGSLRYTDQTHSWAELVERVGGQQWYIDGVNARAAQTGFNWDDVLKFAAVDKTDKDAVEARVIQVYNMPGISDADVRQQVRPYMGAFADKLSIVHIKTNFVNTVNVGTKANPAMGDYVDRQMMIRVSLIPITFDTAGNVTGLDGSKGAGIFVDCANLHWVPVLVYECTDSSCTPPTPTCTTNCNPVYNCPPEMPHGGWEGGRWVCKDDPSRDPEQQENNREGGGGQAPVQTDPIGPPAGGEPPAKYVTPPPPAEVIVPAPIVTPDPVTPDPLPTVDPTEQPPSDGQVPDTGGPNCNPVFQSCP